MDINKLVSDMDPTLWSFISSLTRSISERRGTAKVSDPTTPTHHIKKVHRFFSLCVLLFCTDDWCYLPLHNLITDVVESLGGSTQLVQILNRLGMCSSADTLARSIQYREQECHPHSLTIVSADNIDFLHSYTQVFCGNQTSSWHGTTVQAVQPKPSLHIDRIGSLAETTNAQRVLALPSCTPGDTTTQGQTTNMLQTRDSTGNVRHTECTPPPCRTKTNWRKTIAIPFPI